jgi:D-glycero-alpha-D-manno-heptose 1-phosphate guanylyltransferase
MINKTLIVLAGGFGTRLQSILNGLPKPLADVNGTPFLFYSIQNWISNGFNNIIFSLYFESNKIIDFVESQKSNFPNCSFSYVIEPVPMGTGGAISFLLQQVELGNNFFVANADTWIENGYSTLDTIEGNVIGVVEVNDTRRYGKISFDNENFITHFHEKDDTINHGFINAGIYKLLKIDFSNWDGKPYSIENFLFLKLITLKRLKAQPIITNFIDIGVPEDYYKFCNFNLLLK